jgi:hypothetical protein
MLMVKVEIFDPAMCCSTGVCGPSIDPELTRMANAVYTLEKRGFDISRYNLANDPGAFADHEVINRILHDEGPDALPVTLVDGKQAAVGKYPSNEDFSKWFEVPAEELNEKRKVRLTLDINKK